MAILGLTELTGCNSIPGFIDAGSLMIFEQSSAPTSWTKITDSNYNDRALRVTGSTVSPGGQLAFSSVFTSSRSISPSPFSEGISAPRNSSQDKAPMPALTTTSVSANASVSPATLQVSQIAAHTHQYLRSSSQFAITRVASFAVPFVYTQNTSDSRGSSSAHTHAISDNHTHPITSSEINQHNHSVPSPSTIHSHTVSMTSRDFNLLYVDVIVCSKS
jgi:hypothetical protein